MNDQRTMEQTDRLVSFGSRDLGKLWAQYIEEAREEAGGTLDRERYAHSGVLVADFLTWAQATINDQ